MLSSQGQPWWGDEPGSRNGHTPGVSRNGGEISRLDHVAAEILDRLRRGEQAKLAEYQARYPDVAESLADMFPALALIERVTRPGPRAEVALDLIDARSIQLGDYRLIRELGRGGMGVVYEAEQLSLGRTVAVKVLARHLTTSPHQRRRFEREARSAARLHHSNIVPIFSVGETKSVCYYVMQYIEGTSLERLVAEARKGPPLGKSRALATTVDAADSASAPPSTDGPGIASSNQPTQEESPLPEGANHVPALDAPSSTFPNHPLRPAPAADFAVDGEAQTSLPVADSRDRWLWIARIGRQAASALNYAHDHGVVHRDIKPANLILDNLQNLWITDFGLAKAADLDDLTATGDLVGTIRYMAPEQFDGTADPRTDVYALGLTLYELAAGQAAFSESDHYKLVRRKTTGAPARLRTLAPGIPGSLETIIHTALEREPENRYPTAAQLAEDLDRFLRDEPIHARPVPVWTRMRLWARRNPAVAALSTLAATALLLGTLVSSWQAVRARDAQHRAVASAAQADAEARAARETIALLRELLSLANPEGALAQPLIQQSLRPAVDRAAAGLEQRYHDRPAWQAILRHDIGSIYRRLGLYSDAVPQLQQALALRADRDGFGSRAYLETAYELAFAHQLAGNPGTGLRVLQPAWMAAQAGPRREEPLALDTGTLLVHIYLGLSQQDQAEYLAPRVHENALLRLGPDHDATIRAAEALATVHRYQGRPALAEVLYREVLDRLQRREGARHPRTLAVRNDLARSLRDLGRPAEAEAIYRDVLADRAAVLPPDHPDTLTTKSALAQVLIDRGQYAEAETLLREVLAKRQMLLTLDHPDVLTTMNHLAQLYRDRGQFDAAEPLLRQALEIRIRKQGESHQHTLVAMDTLAMVCRDQGRPVEAARLLKRELELNRQTMGTSHTDTLTTMNSLARVLLDLGRPAEARELAREADAGLQRYFPPGHPWLLSVAATRALADVHAGQLAQAEPTLLELLQAWLTLQDSSIIQAQAVREHVALLREAQGRFADARRILADLLAERRVAPGPENARTLATQQNLARVLRERGQHAAADAVLAEALAVHRRNPGHWNLLCADALEEQARLLAVAGDSVAAENRLLECLALRSRDLPDHWSTAGARLALARLPAHTPEYPVVPDQLTAAFDVLSRAAEIPAARRAELLTQALQAFPHP